MTSGPNRRLHDRKVLRRPATVLLPGGLTRDVRTWDLGVDGMSLVSPKPIPPGTKCTVTVEWPDAATTLSLSSKAVYCSLLGADGFKVGLVFAGLDAATVQVIEQFVQ